MEMFALLSPRTEGHRWQRLLWIDMLIAEWELRESCPQMERLSYFTFGLWNSFQRYVCALPSKVSPNELGTTLLNETPHKCISPFCSYVIHMPFLWNTISKHVLFHISHQALQKRRFSRLCGSSKQRPGSIPALLTRTWSWGSGLSAVFSPLQRIFFLGISKLWTLVSANQT